mmetsp:Transcript_37096/g.58592  ORF Transcript_37096/g.58592 Transcript_37096/m.58592 type:complete len:271 (+) Transcript_37096:76-888(+)
MTSSPTISNSNADMEMKRLAAHKKTQICKFYELGQCTRGDRCTFAHGSEQLRQAPDFSKTRLCADFIEHGTCHFGRKCSFAHGKRELRPGSAAKLGRPGQLLGSGSMGRGGRMVSPGPVGPVGSIGSMGPMGPAYVQSLHESAAMKLLLDATVTKSTTGTASFSTAAEADDGFGCADYSLSRQVTWEGIESSSAGFLRDVSMSSDRRDGQREEVSQSQVLIFRPEIPELPRLYEELELLVNKTFVEVRFKDQEQPGMRRSRSLPFLKLRA